MPSFSDVALGVEDDDRYSGGDTTLGQQDPRRRRLAPFHPGPGAHEWQGQMLAHAHLGLLLEALGIAETAAQVLSHILVHARLRCCACSLLHSFLDLPGFKKRTLLYRGKNESGLCQCASRAKGNRWRETKGTVLGVPVPLPQFASVRSWN